jgi:hypothetical protein
MLSVNRYIDAELRRFVAERAGYCCEYCLLHVNDTYLGCEIDHIISLKHGGKAETDNLAYSCVFCNRHKGSDIGSLIIGIDEFIRFYNPRKDQWAEHFEIDGAIIRPITNIGEVTCKILNFNYPERIIERKSLIDIDRYPPSLSIHHGKNGIVNFI